MVQEKRFCPIQILIIAFFVAIIIAILIPNYLSFQDNRHNQEVLAQAFSLKSAVEEYALMYQSYPFETPQLVKYNLLVAEGFKNPFNGNCYLPSMNNDPKLGEIIYEPLDMDKNGSIESYSIIAYGKQYGELTPVAYLQNN